MKLFYEYSEYYLEKHQKKDEALRKEIVDFIDSNYKNSDFSLTIIADYFNFNESYFSRLFKDVMGENFINYLERKRLLDADNLLLNSECTIEEISIDCGYTNSDTFRRAYRRYFAISPTQRRTTKV